ncbi:cGMP-specific 3',5'-cyclic phosphodiesterase [Cherax quadricarinatus]
MGAKLACVGDGNQDTSVGTTTMGITGTHDAANPQEEEDAQGGDEGREDAAGDHRKLLELCASLADQDADGIQIKLNTYLSAVCEARLTFLILVSADEELTVHVLGPHRLSCPLTIPVNNNSFNKALTSRRPMTLADMQPSHQEDLWRLLGLLHEADGISSVRRVSMDPAASHADRRGFKSAARNGSARSVDESTSRFKVLSRDLSVDVSRSGLKGSWGTDYHGLAATHKYHRASLPAHRTQKGSRESFEDASPLPTASQQSMDAGDSLPGMPLPESNSSKAASAESSSRASRESFWPRSLLCVPISAPGKDTTDVLACLVNKVPAGDFSQRDVLKVQECFRYTVGMLLNTATAERERRLRTQCQALLNVAQNLFTHLDNVTVLLREIMAEARQLTAAERCSLFLLDREQNQLVAKVFDGESKEESGGEVRLPATQGIAGHVATTGHLINIRDAYAHPLFYRGFDQCTGFKTRNILCFPIKENGQVIGVAELCNKTTGLHFTRFDEELATAFSIYCGISISNSLLYKKVFDTQVRSKLSNELMMFHMKVST